MKPTQKEVQTDQPPSFNDVFNNYLNGLAVGEYKHKIDLIKTKLGWSNQVLSQKRTSNKSGSAIKVAEQIALESITGDKIF
jgi:hypothetical protein